jgi:hypothetical protein
MFCRYITFFIFHFFNSLYLLFLWFLKCRSGFRAIDGTDAQVVDAPISTTKDVCGTLSTMLILNHILPHQVVFHVRQKVGVLFCKYFYAIPKNE